MWGTRTQNSDPGMMEIRIREEDYGKVQELLKDRTNKEIEDIIARDDRDSMMRWIKHHLDGDWHTSRLLRFIAQCDENNRAKMELAYPSEVSLWYWYKTGENPRHRDARHRLQLEAHETVVGEV
jgi:hypothetical protein